MPRARVKVSIRDVDRGWNKLKEFAKRVGEGKTYVKVGVVGPAALETREGGISTVGLAVVHELGAPDVGIPERSFLRATFDRNRGVYRALLKQLLQAMIAKRPRLNERQALAILGAKMAGDVKRYITEGTGVPPPLSPETIARKMAKGGRRRRGADGRYAKKGATPRALVDTGRLLNSISWIVVLKGREQKGGK